MRVGRPRQVVGVAHQGAGAVASRVYQNIERRHLAERVMGTERKSLGCADRLSVAGDAPGCPAVLRVSQRPVRKDFPGADRVELLDVVEDQETQVSSTLRAGRARTAVGLRLL